MSELKDCPFCGGAAESRRYELVFFCQCVECFANTCADYESEQVSIAAWNTRALPEGYVLVPVAQLKKIHRDLDACQKLIWGNMKGCDPAYYEDALVSLGHIDAMLAAAKEVDS